MVRRRNAQLAIPQIMLFGLTMPSCEELMDPELRRIDGLLDDDPLVDAVVRAMKQRYPQSATLGRHGTPAEVALRILVLRHLRNWSFERLVWEVTGNLVYRRFCRIDAQKVPGDKTLIKLQKVIDPATLRAVFDRCVRIAVDNRATTGAKARIDTTVVEAPIRYPTDSGLCEDAVRVLSRGIKRLAAEGVALGIKFRNVHRSVSRRMREIAQALRLRGDAAKEGHQASLRAAPARDRPHRPPSTSRAHCGA